MSPVLNTCNYKDTRVFICQQLQRYKGVYLPATLKHAREFVFGDVPVIQCMNKQYKIT